MKQVAGFSRTVCAPRPKDDVGLCINNQSGEREAERNEDKRERERETETRLIERKTETGTERDERETALCSCSYHTRIDISQSRAVVVCHRSSGTRLLLPTACPVTVRSARARTRTISQKCSRN